MTEQTGAAGGTEQDTPPWGEDFDAEKAWNLVKNLRDDKEKLAKRPVLDDEASRKVAEYDRLAAASKTDLDRANEELSRWQTEAQKWRTTSIASRIEALAAPDFQYPADAVGRLDASKYLDAGGTVNEDAIKADLAKLLEERPTWRRASDNGDQQQPRVPVPNRAQGSSGTAASADPAQQFAAIMRGKLG